MLKVEGFEENLGDGDTFKIRSDQDPDLNDRTSLLSRLTDVVTQLSNWYKAFSGKPIKTYRWNGPSSVFEIKLKHDSPDLEVTPLSSEDDGLSYLVREVNLGKGELQTFYEFLDRYWG